MKYFRYGHCKDVYVKLGDRVKKGSLISTVGTGNGQWSAHLHFDVILKKLADWADYVFGMTKEQVKAIYDDPTQYIKIVFPDQDHFGWRYLEYAKYESGKDKNGKIIYKYCYHPGIDLNGPGAGNADLGDHIFSACDGEVVYCYDGSEKNDGWGKLIIIKESEVDNEATTEKKNRIEEWALAIKKHEGWFEGSASYRNNNLGNLRCSALVMGELGAIKCVNNLAVFPDYETGFKALKQFLIYACTDQLKSYKSEMTLFDFYKVYAPGSDNNNPLNYATCIANDLKITVDTKIKELYKQEDNEAQNQEEAIPEAIETAKEETVEEDAEQNNLDGYINSNGQTVGDETVGLLSKFISWLINLILKK